MSDSTNKIKVIGIHKLDYTDKLLDTDSLIIQYASGSTHQTTLGVVKDYINSDFLSSIEQKQTELDKEYTQLVDGIKSYVEDTLKPLLDEKIQEGNLTDESINSLIEEYLTSRALDGLINDLADQAHVHTNKDALDKISEDEKGNLLYNGEYIQSGGIATIDKETIIRALSYTPLDNDEKGQANGVATLNSDGIVPYEQLPDKLQNSLELGDTSSTAFRGDYGNIAYEHSKIVKGNPHNVTLQDLNISLTSDIINALPDDMQVIQNLLDTHTHTNFDNLTLQNCVVEDTLRVNNTLNAGETNLSSLKVLSSEINLNDQCTLVYNNSKRCVSFVFT